MFKADVFVETLKPGDRVLLCSDGFCRYAEDPAIVKKFMQTGTPEQIVTNCIQYARNSGGQDNITVLSMEIGELLEEIPDGYDQGARPDPVDLREVVSNPLTLDARSPAQEAAMNDGNVEGTTQMVAAFKPDPSAPEIPVREAYSIAGLNMAADDSDLMDTDNLGDKTQDGTEAAMLLDEETGTTSVTSEQLRTVSSQRIKPEPPSTPHASPESITDKANTRTLSVLVAFSAVIVLILLILAGVLGVRYFQNKKAQSAAAVSTPVIVTEEEVVSPTDTAEPVAVAMEEPVDTPTEEAYHYANGRITASGIVRFIG